MAWDARSRIGRHHAHHGHHGHHVGMAWDARSRIGTVLHHDIQHVFHGRNGLGCPFEDRNRNIAVAGVTKIAGSEWPGMPVRGSELWDESGRIYPLVGVGMAWDARSRIGTILPVEGEDQLQYLWICLFCCFCYLSSFIVSQADDAARPDEPEISL